MADRSSWLHFSGEEVLAFLEEEEVKYEEMDDNIYAPSSDVDLGVDSDMEKRTQCRRQVTIVKTCV